MRFPIKNTAIWTQGNDICIASLVELYNPGVTYWNKYTLEQRKRLSAMHNIKFGFVITKIRS